MGQWAGPLVRSGGSRPPRRLARPVRQTTVDAAIFEAHPSLSYVAYVIVTLGPRCQCQCVRDYPHYYTTLLLHYYRVGIASRYGCTQLTATVVTGKNKTLRGENQL